MIYQNCENDYRGVFHTYEQMNLLLTLMQCRMFMQASDTYSVYSLFHKKQGELIDGILVLYK